MTEIEIKELLNSAASPHLIASAAKSTEMLMRLQALKTDLRLEVNQLELEADLALNQIFKTEIAIEKGKAQWRVSAVYREWKGKAGLLSDVRAVYRNLERHCDMLINQEKYSNKAYLG